MYGADNRTQLYLIQIIISQLYFTISFEYLKLDPKYYPLKVAP